MGKKSKANNLGRALIRDRFNQGHRRTVDNNSMVKIFMCLQTSNFLFIIKSYQLMNPFSPRKNSCTQQKSKMDMIGDD